VIAFGLPPTDFWQRQTKRCSLPTLLWLIGKSASVRRAAGPLSSILSGYKLEILLHLMTRLA
jgi:hypothetical protein